MSPQVHLHDSEGPKALFEYGMHQDVSILHLKDNTMITVPYNNINRLPLLCILTDLKKSESAFTEYQEGGLLDEQNQNLLMHRRLC